jgi:uncharacterized membrane protein YoaK (UPF0700 family)
VLLAILLASVAGFVDGAGYLLLQKVFVAHQSGNTVASFVGVAQHDWSLVLRRGVPIALFVLGIAAAAAALEVGGRRRVPRLTSLTLSVEAALLSACMATGATFFHRAVGESGPIGSYLPLLAMLVLAMGLQTATLRKIGRRTVRTTYVSGMLTHFAEDGVRYFFDRRDAGPDPESQRELAERRHRLAVIAGIWCSYATGGVLGGLAEIGWTTYALGAPAGLLAVLVAVDQRRPWHAPSEDVLHEAAAADDLM